MDAKASRRSCRCPFCFGLREYMEQLTGRDHGLQPAPGHDPAVETPPDRPRCDGSMTCSCPSCQEARASQKASPVRQPWEPKPRTR